MIYARKIGGILMIFNPIGLMILDFTFFDSLGSDYESTELIDLHISVFFLISGFLVMSGGIAVIYGVFIIAKDRSRLGKDIISVAAVINVMVSLAFISLFSVLGLFLTVIAYRSLHKNYENPR